MPLLGCVHAPPLQTSFVQLLPSSAQDAVLFGCVHAPAAHTSFVQTLPSSPHGFVFAGCVHAPRRAHVVRAHVRVIAAVVPFATGVFWQPVAGLHESVVHSLESPAAQGNVLAPRRLVA